MLSEPSVSIMSLHDTLLQASLTGVVLGGFTVVYFQVPWVTTSGPAITFGCQAAIVAFFILSIITTQLFGARWRERFPPPKTSRTM